MPAHAPIPEKENIMSIETEIAEKLYQLYIKTAEASRIAAVENGATPLTELR